MKHVKLMQQMEKGSSSNDNKSEKASSVAGSEDNLTSSENEASDNGDSEEESDGEEAYGSHEDTKNYNQSDDDSGNKIE